MLRIRCTVGGGRSAQAAISPVCLVLTATVGVLLNTRTTMARCPAAGVVMWTANVVMWTANVGGGVVMWTANVGGVL